MGVVVISVAVEITNFVDAIALFAEPSRTKRRPMNLKQFSSHRFDVLSNAIAIQAAGRQTNDDGRDYCREKKEDASFHKAPQAMYASTVGCGCSFRSIRSVDGSIGT